MTCIMTKIGYDTIKLDQALIVQDTKRWLKVNAVISRSGVYQYDDGKAFKSKAELLKATRTARYAKLAVGDHPGTQVVVSQKDLKGGVENPHFDNGKIRGTLAFDKRELPEEIINRIKNAIVSKVGIDNSIGFYYETDKTPGIDRNVNSDAEEHYDYIMRDIVIDHVAVVIDPNRQGRCTFPKCGVGADCLTCPRKIGKTFTFALTPITDSMVPRPEFKVDKVVQRGNEWCVIHCHGEEAGEVIKCFPTKGEAEAMHRAIQAQKGDELKGGKKEMSEKDYEEFKKDHMAHGYTEQQAKDYWDEYVIGIKDTIPSAPSVTPKPVEEPPKEVVKMPETPKEPIKEEPKQETPPSAPIPELTAEQLLDRSKELLKMREESVIEKNRADRRHPV